MFLKPQKALEQRNDGESGRKLLAYSWPLGGMVESGQGRDMPSCEYLGRLSLLPLCPFIRIQLQLRSWMKEGRGENNKGGAPQFICLWTPQGEGMNVCLLCPLGCCSECLAQRWPCQGPRIHSKQSRAGLSRLSWLSACQAWCNHLNPWFGVFLFSFLPFLGTVVGFGVRLLL